jgi:L-gulonolactone oxidase
VVSVWTNWAGTAQCRPSRVERPSSEEEIVSIVKAAGAAREPVKVAGAGHSFTDIACTTGRLISLDGYARVLGVDPDARTVTVQAGMRLERLNAELSARGLALENLGDIAYQSVAGAIATATHGTGARVGNLATQVSALRLVTADGSIMECSAEADLEVFRAAQVSLGALGVISTVTLRCVPAFNLHALEEPRRLEEIVEHLDALVDGNDHFEFFWFPHTDVALAKTNNRTESAAAPRGRLRSWVDDILLENRAFGAVARLGRARPAWIPPLARLTGRLLSRSELVDRSDRVFASARLVRFAEMEYAIPRATVVDAIREVRGFIERRDLRVNFPVEVRFVAPDDILLSTANSRETACVAVHLFQRMDYEPYFRGVERIMDSFQGRPHWGKIHFQTAETLGPRYPAWNRFAAVRARLDPEGLFRNAYLDRVLG